MSNPFGAPVPRAPDATGGGIEPFPPQAPTAAGRTISIGEVSRRTGCTLRALRFWQEKGLLAPERRGVSRFYDEADIARAAAIRLMVDAGIELRWVAIILRHADEGRTDGLTLAQQVIRAGAVVRERRKALESLRETTLYTQGRLS